MELCFRRVICFWTLSFAHNVLLQSGFEAYLPTWHCHFWIQNVISNMLLSFNVKLVLQFGVTIWIWSFVSDLLLLLKFETSIPTWCCNSDSKFPFQLFTKTQIQNIVSELLLWFSSEASLSSCYYNTNLKLCFWFLVRI